MPTGTIMIAALTFLIGFQLLLSFLNYDISASPREPLHPFLAGRARLEPAAPRAEDLARPEVIAAEPKPTRKPTRRQG